MLSLLVLRTVQLRRANKKPLLAEDDVELLTLPSELAEYRQAITEAMYKGAKRNIESEDDLKKPSGRVTDEELLTRLRYYGVARLHLSRDEVWTAPFGLLLDLVECHKQYNGISKPRREHFIDEIIPEGI